MKTISHYLKILLFSFCLITGILTIPVTVSAQDATSTQLPANGWYKNPNGAMNYYLNGTKKTGWLTIKQKRYFFDNEGVMKTGWLTLNGNKYYLSPNSKTLGQMAVGYVKIGKTWNHFAVDGKAASGAQLAMFQKARTLKSSTKHLILVNTKTNRLGIFKKDSKEKWKMIHYWKCGTGKRSTPSVHGTFRVNGRGLSFGAGYTCWYWVRWYGNYLFHSVLYYPGSQSRIMESGLGRNSSHGCIRLTLQNAKWIYRNISNGTKVKVY